MAEVSRPNCSRLSLNLISFSPFMHAIVSFPNIWTFPHFMLYHYFKKSTEVCAVILMLQLGVFLSD
jgi:hypothetical protein